MITICECFARDGLQHEPAALPTAGKVAAIDAFTAAGFRRIEATSYSHPDRVPAFRDASAVLAGIRRGAGVHYKATCPNPRAVGRALADLDPDTSAVALGTDIWPHGRWRLEFAGEANHAGTTRLA